MTKAETIRAQIEKIRLSGATNMLDAKRVFEIAVENGDNELADFIFADTKAYSNYIMKGECDDECMGRERI